MKRKYVYASLCLSYVVVVLFLFSQIASAAESGCIKCHTDEQLLKSLYKPKQITSSEGEG